MPKRLHQQRRGKGSPKYTSPSHRYAGVSKYRSYDSLERKNLVMGKVIDLVNCSGRTAPLMKVTYETGETVLLPAPEKISVGDIVYSGLNAKPQKNNVLPLAKIPEGTLVYNIELIPGDGGKLVRCAGNTARVISKEKGHVVIQLPSKSFKKLNSASRATIGIVSGGGRKEKPMLKAGKKFHAMKNKAKIWPVVAGTAMNPVDHPHGGGGRRNRKSKTVSRRAPPGRKVGSIASRRTGRKKRK